MPRCTNCNYKWKVKEVLSLGFSKNGKDCPNCGHRQYISPKTQRLFTLGYLSLIFVPFIIFRIKLSDKDEPLW
ncbi:TIGR04104 family putative zinc finger protein [Virgibacillus halophilus]|uniref:TIGR04104 family putative zinc finger protein n=1 Tax=Tigheibacillus halophilus TaxID=361280 RepID=UPI003624E478